MQLKFDQILWRKYRPRSLNNSSKVSDTKRREKYLFLGKRKGWFGSGRRFKEYTFDLDNFFSFLYFFDNFCSLSTLFLFSAKTICTFRNSEQKSKFKIDSMNKVMNKRWFSKQWRIVYWLTISCMDANAITAAL